MDKILFLVGPTASGKTEVAVELAKEIDAEIISCDSMQIYKGMDVLTQKPTPSQRAAIVHHMINILNPDREFNVADHKKRAEDIIKRIHRKGKMPLVVGGSGLYVKALIDGLFPSDSKDTELRARLLGLSKKYGNKYLHNRLKRVDPEAAKTIHPNNVRRVIRALEVFEISGVPISQMKNKTKGLSSEYKIIIFGLRRERQDLYERINRRTRKMFKEGLIDEVESLRKLSASQTAKVMLGYKEVTGYLDSRYTREKAQALLMQNTRRFAKKQMSWFRKDHRIIWIDVAKNERKREIVDKILNLTKQATLNL